MSLTEGGGEGRKEEGGRGGTNGESVEREEVSEQDRIV